MAQVGYVLSHEQFPVPQLVELAAAAEDAGFDRLWTSDHFHPWMDNQGHSGHAWLTLAAISQRVRLPFGTGVTCPTFRYRPAIVAQAFATLSALAPGRVFLGVGSGEAINEQATTGTWAPYAERAERLIEAIGIIRGLWTGDWISSEGRYYQVPNAKLYDPPPQPIPLFVAAGGTKSMRLTGRYGDGLISDARRAVMPEMRGAFEDGAREAGRDPVAIAGRRGPRLMTAAPARPLPAPPAPPRRVAPSPAAIRARHASSRAGGQPPRGRG
jgi:TAT-translocated FGD2 family F420-dependent dehydrogenase